MRALVLGGALLLLDASARAQSLGIQTVCVGVDAPVVTFGMVIVDGAEEVTNIGGLAAGSVINEAECRCNSRDLALQGVISRALPTGFQPPFSVWEGSGCNAVTSRSTTSNICEQIAADVSPMSFWAGGTSDRPQQRIDVRALIAPLGGSSPSNPLEHTCPPGGLNISNAVWFLFGDPNNPAYCSVVVPVDTLPPTAPIDFTAGPGDGSVRLDWDVPPIGTSQTPTHFQVLCADASGNPIPGQGGYDMADFIGERDGDLHPLQYSVCTASGLQRRVLATGSPDLPGQLDGGADLDGGVVIDGGVFNPFALPAGGRPGDATGEDGPAVLTPSAITVAPSSVLATMDKRFVCSDPLDNLGREQSFRVKGLANDVPYHFAVLSVDAAGNATSTPVLVVTPRPTQDLYQRFVATGGEPQGFCFIATAAHGSYQSPYVRVLREFRDQALLPHAWGRAFVAWYYRASPPWADWIAHRPAARWLVRQALWPVIAVAALWLWLAWWQQLLALAAGVAVLRRWKRRAR